MSYKTDICRNIVANNSNMKYQEEKEALLPEQEPSCKD